jgi:hypothetical protein
MTPIHEKVIGRIEDAVREQPFCACGEPAVPVAYGRDIWLDCITRTEPKRGFARLLAFATSHLHRPVVDGELAAAA